MDGQVAVPTQSVGCGREPSARWVGKAIAEDWQQVSAPDAANELESNNHE